MKITNHLNFDIDQNNKRLRVFNYDEEPKKLSKQLNNIAEEENLEKIIIFGNEKEDRNAFFDQGFIQEGKIDGFYNGKPAYLLSKYLTDDRQASDIFEKEDHILQEILNSTDSFPQKISSDNILIREANTNDIPDIVNMFKQVFVSYPTPMDNEEYVKKAINTNVDMVVAEEQNEIIGVSSAEIDFENNNAEITDCATHPKKRGKGIMNHLIRHLEKKMEKRNIVNLFSIARARSYGMNKVLYNLDYHYGGRLINNVHIAGNWEDMNIWSKKI